MAIQGTTGKITTSTQRYLTIAGIKQNTVIMKDGSLRAIIMVSSINFSLKSEDEQNAIIGSYVSFLNNLTFPIQITIQSRELNIDNYLEDLHQKEKRQTNELLKMQMGEYSNYIKELISMGKIMNKRFFVTVPYNPGTNKQKGFFARLTESLNPASLIKMKEERFFELRQELNRRIDSVTSGLNSMGLNAVELDTQGLIELLYETYNPVTGATEKMADVNKLRIDENI